MNPDPTMLVFAAATALLAFFVQGFTGFGASLILAPLLLFVLDLKTGVVASAIVQLPIGVGLTLGLRQHIDHQELRAVLPLSVLGLGMGMLALTYLDVAWLKRLCGLVTVVFAVRMLLRLRRSQAGYTAWPAWTRYLAGLIAGVLGAVFGTSGPPIIIVLERRLPQKVTLRATLLAYFLVLNLLRLLGYVAGMLVTGHVLTVSLAMMPAATLGAFLGTRMQQRVGDQAFRFVVSLVLLLTGLALAWGR